MKRRVVIVTLAVAGLALLLYYGSMVRNPDERSKLQAAHAFRKNLAEQAAEAWGKRNIRIDSLRGPDDALALVLTAAAGSCTEQAIHLFILNAFGSIAPVKTITCNEQGKSIAVEVRPYLDRVRATYPMAPDRADTKIEFGGTVRRPRDDVWQRTPRFKTRSELIDFLQLEPQKPQFGVSPELHTRGFRVHAAEHDDRILVVETAACDDPVYRYICFSYDGLNQATMVQWTELGGTFMVCKGERNIGFIGMRAAVDSIGLYPVNSVAECSDRQIEDRCN